MLVVFAIIIIAFLIVETEAESTFWPNWKIKQCPDKLKAAATLCDRKEFAWVVRNASSLDQEAADEAYNEAVEREMVNCYVHQVFGSDVVDLMYCKELLYSIEIDHQKAEVAAAKKLSFIRSAKRALIDCFDKHRLSINYENFAFRKCIYQTLTRVCHAEALYIAPDMHPFWHPGLNPYWDKKLTTSGSITPPPPLMLLVDPGALKLPGT